MEREDYFMDERRMASSWKKEREEKKRLEMLAQEELSVEEPDEE